jgi:hypothetical protein
VLYSHSNAFFQILDLHQSFGSDIAGHTKFSPPFLRIEIRGRKHTLCRFLCHVINTMKCENTKEKHETDIKGGKCNIAPGSC